MENQKEDIEEMINLIEGKKKKQIQPVQKNNKEIRQKSGEKIPAKKNEAIRKKLKETVEEINEKKRIKEPQAFEEEKIPETPFSEKAVPKTNPASLEKTEREKEIEKQPFLEKKVEQKNLAKTLENTKREKEIEKMIGFLEKDDELLKKDRLTEKVNKLVEETERDLGKISYAGRKPEKKESKKESFFSKLKKQFKK